MSNVECIALVAKTTNLQKIPFVWHIMSSEDYERQVKAKGDMKRFDFIHMIQVLRLYFFGHSAEVHGLVSDLISQCCPGLS